MSEPESKGDIVRPMPPTTGHTPTPWEYRPHRYDDWGWIRGPMAEGDSIGPLVATSRNGRYDSPETLDQHRSAGTDPYGANAALIIGAVNALDEILITLRHARVFIKTREKMHPEGVRQYDELIDRLHALVGTQPTPSAPDVLTPAQRPRE